MTDMLIVKAVSEAFEQASKATKSFLSTHGDRDCCGFAWVVVKPANSKLAKYLKTLGASNAYRGGVQVWNPSGHPTQALTAKEEGAYAFAKVLRDRLGVWAYAESRMD